MQNLLRVFSFRHGVSLPRTISIALVYRACSESPSSAGDSALWYSVLKNVWILAIVVAIRKFVQVQRQVFPADVVVGAHDAALQQAPERIQIVGVNDTMNVFASTVANMAMLESETRKVMVPVCFISGDKFDIFADGFLDKIVERGLVGAFNDAADHVALARDGSDDANLSAPAGNMAFLVPVAILVLSADVGFVNFHDAHQLLEIGVLHSSAQPMAHIPCGVVSGAGLPGDLQCADAFLAVEHLPEHFKPYLEVDVRILKRRAHGHGETIARPLGRRAALADPVKRARLESVDLYVAAADTANFAIRPAALHQELLAGIVVWKSFHQLLECHHNEGIISQAKCGVKC